MSNPNDPNNVAARIAAVDTERRLGDVRVQQERAATDRVSRELAATRQQMLDAPRPKPVGWHELQEMEGKLCQAQQERVRLERLIMERDSNMREWRHSNDSFKTVARLYAKRLGLSDEERMRDFRQAVVDVAGEQPEFAKTQLLVRSKEKLDGKPEA